MTTAGYAEILLSLAALLLTGCWLWNRFSFHELRARLAATEQALRIAIAEQDRMIEELNTRLRHVLPPEEWIRRQAHRRELLKDLLGLVRTMDDASPGGSRFNTDQSDLSSRESSA